MKICGETKTRNKVKRASLCRCVTVVFVFMSYVCAPQARRRTTTQMELLYANSDSAADLPTADFSGPMLPLAETPDGGGDLDSSVRDYTALSPGFSSKTGSM